MIDAFHLSIYTPYIGPATSLCLSFGVPKGTSTSLAHGSPENREALPRLGLLTPGGQHKDTPLALQPAIGQKRSERIRPASACKAMLTCHSTDVMGVSVETRHLQSDNVVASSPSPSLCRGTNG